MMEIKYSQRAFINKQNNQVMLRVRWLGKQREVGFVTGVYAQEDKWDSDLQKAKKSTTHIVRNMKFSAAQINEVLAELRETVECCFRECAKQNFVPTTEQLKAMVNNERNECEQSTAAPKTVRLNFKQLFDSFLENCGREKNWDRKAKEKYQQAFHQITAANPHISPDHIDVNTMYRLRDWYVANGYKNRTINKQTVMVKAILHWIDQQPGYSIPPQVLEFSTNLKVIPKTVTFLKYKELMTFYNFPFEDERLANARDLWCFMAFTSLRFSDLDSLRQVHIIDGERIEMFTQKTDGHITIPLIDEAKAIIERHKVRAKHGRIFNSISNQKLNDYVKEAAEVAGLDREVQDVYYLGTERHDEVKKFYEIISCHAARRTFVSCSLAMGIPAEVVMKCTGHSDYKTMKPYIETNTEAQALEMSKWNANYRKTQIITALEGKSAEELDKIWAEIQKVIA